MAGRDGGGPSWASWSGSSSFPAWCAQRCALGSEHQLEALSGAGAALEDCGGDLAASLFSKVGFSLVAVFVRLVLRFVIAIFARLCQELWNELEAVWGHFSLMSSRAEDALVHHLEMVMSGWSSPVVTSRLVDDRSPSSPQTPPQVEPLGLKPFLTLPHSCLPTFSWFAICWCSCVPPLGWDRQMSFRTFFELDECQYQCVRMNLRKLGWICKNMDEFAKNSICLKSATTSLHALCLWQCLAPEVPPFVPLERYAHDDLRLAQPKRELQQSGSQLRWLNEWIK